MQLIFVVTINYEIIFNNEKFQIYGSILSVFGWKHMHLVEYRDQLNMQFTEACTYLLSHTWTCARVTVVVLCVCTYLSVILCVCYHASC